MQVFEVGRAITAATAVAVSLGLAVDDARVLHNSNQLTLRLTPCDVVVRVTHAAHGIADRELRSAQLLAVAGCPVGVPDPRVAPEVYTSDGFALTLWVYYASDASGPSPADYALALRQLHRGLRAVHAPSPQFRDRVAEAEQVVADRQLSPELGDADRAFLGERLASARASVERYGAVEQLLHGEPHPGNVLATRDGARFIDFETLCRGPVEFDLAHAPEAVCEHYPGIDPELVADCRQLVLGMVAAWRWQIGDEFPDGRRWGHEFLRTLRAGPPWPTLQEMTRRFGGG